MTLVDDALKVAKKYAVFPTTGKVPSWSNLDLEGIGLLPADGKGGYHIATRDPEAIRVLFRHTDATHIGVPCRPNGLVVVDADSYKPGVPQWEAENMSWLGTTLAHDTPAGGSHYIFKDPGGPLPGNLAPGVELKSNGFVNWPPARGYKRRCRKSIKEFPQGKEGAKDLAARHQPAGSGTVVSTQELIRRVHSADELYPALRALSWRLTNQGLSVQAVADGLRSYMASSVAAGPGHPRHEDWLDRSKRLQDLATSAAEKIHAPDIPLDLVEKARAEGVLGLIFGKPAPLAPSAVATAAAAADDDVWENLIGPAMEGAERREWVLPDMLPASQLSVLSASGGTGKSVLSIQIGLSVVAGLDLLGTGEPRKRNVWIVNNEDDVEEMRRRLWATRDEMGLDLSKAHKMRFQGAPIAADQSFLELAHRPDGGEVIIFEATFDMLRSHILRDDIGLLVLDPFISMIRGAATNDNDTVYAVAQALRKLAQSTKCAILVIHHNRKGTTDRSSAENLMGAASLANAARSVLTAEPIDKPMLRGLGVKGASLDLPYPYFSLARAKQNLSANTGLTWFEMVSHTLPNGDGVGVPTLLGSTAELRQKITSKQEEHMSLVGIVDSIVETVAPGHYHSLVEVFVAPFDSKEDWPYTKGSRALRDAPEDFKIAIIGLSGGSVQIREPRKAGTKRSARYLIIITAPPESPAEGN